MGESHFCFLASFYFVAMILLVCLQANTAVMILTTLLVKVNDGFISPTATPDAGAELDLLLLATALTLTVLGSGPLTIEHNLLQREL